MSLLNVRLITSILRSPFTGHLRGSGTGLRCMTTEGTTPHQEEDVSRNSDNEDESNHTDAADGEEQLKKQILDAALPFVHSLGWSQDALAQGAESLGYSGMAEGLFPKGEVELVNHFYVSCNEKLRGSLEERLHSEDQQPQSKDTSTFLANAVEERLRMNVEYIDIWHKALALHASPTNASSAINNLTTLTDHIWYYAGDRSTDFNWYAKRGVLAAVYKSSEIYMLQDKSDDFQETWAFMNRRLSEAQSVGKCAQSAEFVAENFKDVAKAGVSTITNILGMRR